MSDRLITFGRRLPAAATISTEPDWKQSRPNWIDKALAKSQTLPSGGWYVLGSTREIGSGPRRYRVAGEDYVAWRGGDGIRVAPDTCPHMGASLADGFVRDGCIVCPWHGLALGGEPHGAWRPAVSYDDGVLVWIRPGRETDASTPTPFLTPRPERFLDAVMRRDAGCDPEDVIANRLDPWHGVHFHGHSFGRLKIIEQTEDTITARVVYKIVGRIGMEVDARFHCPDPRTIVMTIVAGEGEGSVVETHATPIEPGRTAIIEATLATSHRPQFHTFVRLFGNFIRPTVEKRADRLWVEDAAYAERRYAIRQKENPAGL